MTCNRLQLCFSNRYPQASGGTAACVQFNQVIEHRAALPSQAIGGCILSVPAERSHSRATWKSVVSAK
jgi:hypothetical protein